MIRTDLLRRLVTHLRTGNLGHRKFDFNCINRGDTDAKGCGTLGCAMGELPILFPREWCFAPHANARRWDPELIEGHRDHTRYDVEEFFGIDHHMVDHLFFPHNQSSRYGDVCEDLPKGATKEEVAQNIESFCNWAEEKGLHK